MTLDPHRIGRGPASTTAEQEALDAIPAMQAAIEGGRFIYGDSVVVPRRGAECWDWLMDHITLAYTLVKAGRVARLRILITYDKPEAAE